MRVILGASVLIVSSFVGERFAGTSCRASEPASAAHPRRVLVDESISKVVTLQQNWTDAESNWFYSVPQGSRLIPYPWILHLEQPANATRFLDPQHIRSFGYVPRAKSMPGNPEGLPIGFAKEAAYDDGTPSVGFTCAACHTGVITHNKVAYLVDGAPTMGDMESLIKALARSLEATRDDPAKFKRFAENVLGDSYRDDQAQLLRDKLRQVIEERSGYNLRNFPRAGEPAVGNGRVDAFSSIANEVTTRFLHLSGNVATADAAVSYPFLWDTPQHDRVQWNGGASNGTNPIGELLFGTESVGALGRNAGEVLGVFGHVTVNANEGEIPKRYKSTVNRENLILIEKSLAKLWSPQWPDAFGKIDEERRARGELLFEQESCNDCHHSIVRDDPGRSVEAQLRDVGTDAELLENLRRSVDTGVLKGRQINLLSLDRFGDKAPVAIVLQHMVQRSILRDIPTDQVKAMIAQANSGGQVELESAFVPSAFLKVKDELVEAKYSEITDEKKVKLDRSGLDRLSQRFDDEIGLESVPGGSVQSKFARLKNLGLESIRQNESGEAENATVDQNRLANQYKARPLNGIWATAPYLHNGSVPTLMALLKPVKDRPKTFRVGGTEIDTRNVGFIEVPEASLFDTQDTGNSNSGHEYGSELNDEQRLDLIEYLKSL